MAEAQADDPRPAEGRAASRRPAPFLDASVRERWNDYGIGLLLQGDLKGAEAAFLKVTRMEPALRRRLGERRPGAAHRGQPRGRRGGAAARRSSSTPVSPRPTSSSAPTLKQSGRYDEALEHLRRAAALYPRDRVVRNQIGRVLFLKRQYREAIAELRQVLAIDPEDLQAHYNLMLSYQGVGDSEMAKRHEALYRRFKADESAQTITGPYRQLHPHDNNERQAVHEHASGLGGGPRYGPPRGRRERGASDEPRRRCARRSSLLLPRPRRRAPPRAQAGAGIQFADGTAARRHRLPPQLGRLREEVPAGDDGLGPRRSSTTTTTAGSTSSSPTGRRWPGRPGPADLLRALPQQPGRHVHRRHAGGRPRARDVRDRRRPRPTTTTTAGRTSTSPRSAATTSSATWATGRSPTSPRSRARRGRAPSARARCSSTTTGTGSSTSWSPTT